ncbi:MAG: bifunctional pyr operon transcriptional regulator/uracil phosphoribosyltransferase PyrR [Clostridia bacterium]
MNLKVILMDEIAIDRALTRISHEIIEHNKGVSNIALVGIVTRGAPLCYRLSQKLASLEGEVLCGKLDITLYRDDLTELSSSAQLNNTSIDFDVTGKDIILVDDVIFTGRTVRAGLEAIIALGRPRSIQLAVLIDRGHRELPIRPDYVGKNIPTSLNEVVAVRLFETDKIDSVALFTKD